LEAHREFVAGQARLRDHDFGRSDGKSITEVDRVFQRTVDREILAKDSWRQRPARQLAPPILVVREGVAVDGLVLTAVDGEIRLAVAIQVQLSQRNAVFNRLLVDPGRDFRSPPKHFAGQSNVE
jgi:hypothetical protein